jgi:hypothetical protein
VKRFQSLSNKWCGAMVATKLDVDKALKWKSNAAIRKFLGAQVEMASGELAEHIRKAQMIHALATSLKHAWSTSKANRRYDAVEAALVAFKSKWGGLSNTALRKMCKQIGFNLKTGTFHGSHLGDMLRGRKDARIKKCYVKTLPHVKMCLVVTN